MNKPGTDVFAKPWSESIEAVCKHFDVSLEKGLGKDDVRRLRERYGANALREVREKGILEILSNQLQSLIVVLLCVAAVLSFVLQEWMDGVAIVVVILINTVIGFAVELKAVRSMESLRRMEKITAKVRRQGLLAEIPASQLVPGDIVIIEGGDMVSADVRLIRSSKLEADESMLTGESLPVGKHVDAILASAILAERANMLFKGTAVTRGSSEGVVVATGMHTELGNISVLVADAEATATPLEKRLERLAQKLLWVTLVIIVLIVTAGIARGKEIMLMIETAIALAVAAIPEGLPVVATMALARGMGRMARKNALLNRLGAVETLGGTSVICTDKTGTLTENRMTVTRVLLTAGEIEIEPGDLQKVSPFKKDGNSIEAKDDEILYEALEIGTLCNNASLTAGKKGKVEGVGDPVETALLVAAAKAGIRRENLNERFPETREEAFDSDIKIMGTFHKVDGEYRVAVKGAPEAVLDICSRVRTAGGEKTLDDETRQWWVRQNAALADEGLRILALAGKTVDSDEVDPYEELVLTGLVAMLDPPRKDVKSAIASCHKAGIRVVMVTGDQAKTAASIAAAVGLVEDKEADVVSSRDIEPTAQMSDEDRRRYSAASIFARVSPRQKLDLIDLHQQAGYVVAMTGDGVNDAPALKKADIGIAMGQRGTQVAREAADMVLEDDSFSTIVAAVEQGRVIFGNIRKFVLYLLSCNVSEVMIVFLASLVNAPMPILPLQILFLNLVTDIFPALALGAGEGDSQIMDLEPRDSNEPLLTAGHWFAVVGYGSLITFSVLGSFAAAFFLLDMSNKEAVTVSFLTLGFCQIWHIFNMRDRGTSWTQNEVVRNKWAWLAIIFSSGLLVTAVYLPVISNAMKLAKPGFAGWLIIISTSLFPCFVGQILKGRASS